MRTSKPFNISEWDVWKAYKKVKANRGAAGVDEQSIEEFDKEMKSNLYRIWNRMSSGSYFPPPVKEVEIPKSSGNNSGVRKLGVPTVSDRVAQMVVKSVLEPLVEPRFHPDSYGYRPRKSALEAVGVAKQRCWKYDWVVDLDIKNFFDSIDHKLVMRAVKKHVDSTKHRWVILYIERWLKAPVMKQDGTLEPRSKGSPQGSVISPLLSNLFLHYVFDEWMRRKYPEIPFERYADDAILHCKTENQAHFIRKAVAERMLECGLELHPDKTKVVYCKDSGRRGRYPVIAFDFLGFTFQPRMAKNRVHGVFFTNFSPAISRAAAKDIRATIRSWQLQSCTGLTLQELARKYNPAIRGWQQYYGQYGRGIFESVMRHFEPALVRWALQKYKKLRGHKRQTWRWLRRRMQQCPTMFAHWPAQLGLSTVGAV